MGYDKNVEGQELGCDHSTTLPAVVLDVIAHHDLGELSALLEQEKRFRKNYTKFNRLLQQVGYKLVCDGKKITVHIPDGKQLEFKYLKFDRSKTKKSGQQYHYLCLQSERVIMIPRHEPITEIKKDVDISEEADSRELFIPLEGDKFKGKKASDVLTNAVLITEAKTQIEEALKKIFFREKINKLSIDKIAICY
ncbi:hypothetical protein [Psychrosphaera algicola]|uniref:Uncharacterized protein n=1 Tax=Psychrosphaera algicola TaxID=3023714 RepID=A0ABT5FJW6_9GAMM|nr:hypothetical protein [Psychrosphaera sp. G1-22]MDC2891497.1 hypothetical protein [Psychrosphaera sp. G1-22]